jgi:hypothetical protein
VQTLRGLGYQAVESDDPYSAAAELSRRSMTYRAMILCLNSLYREELSFISSIKHRYPHIDVWLSQTDGRASALAEASRLGADGLLCDDGFQRFAVAPEKLAQASTCAPAPAPAESAPAATAPGKPPHPEPPKLVKIFAEAPIGDPVLTADELRALLHEPARQQPDEK